MNQLQLDKMLTDYKLTIILDEMLRKRKMTLNDLSSAIGVNFVNLAFCKNGHGKVMKFTTLLRICTVLECTPNDIFRIESKQQ